MISGRTNTVTATIGVGTEPVGVAVDPKTNTIYVTNYGQRHGVGDQRADQHRDRHHPRRRPPVGVAVDPKTSRLRGQLLAARCR